MRAFLGNLLTNIASLALGILGIAGLLSALALHQHVAWWIQLLLYVVATCSFVGAYLQWPRSAESRPHDPKTSFIGGNAEGNLMEDVDVANVDQLIGGHSRKNQMHRIKFRGRGKIN